MSNHPPRPQNKRRRMAFFTLRMKMLILFGTLFVTVLAAVNIFRSFGIPGTTFTGGYGQERSQALQGLGLIADLKKERFVLWLEERKNDAKQLSQNLIVVSAVTEISEAMQGKMADNRADRALWSDVLKSQGHQNLTQHLKFFKNIHTVYHKIQVADGRTGMIIASTDNRDLGISVAEGRYFTAALNAGYGESIDIAQDPVSRKPYLVIARIVTNRASPDNGRNKRLALVIMEIDTDDFLKPMLYTGGGLGRSGEIVLVDQEARTLMSLKYPLADGRIARVLEDRISAKPAALALRGEEGITINEDYRGVPVLAAFRHIRVTPDIGWGMVVKQDQSEVFAPLRQRLSYAFLIGLVGIIVAMVSVIVITNRISRPIKSLSQTAQAVENGYLDARSPVMSSDEVGTLAATFNEMIERIQQWHTELEKEVKKRTAQLNNSNKKLRSEVTQRKRAEKELQYSLEELQKTLVGTVTVLAMTCEIRDPYTAGHQQQVAKLAGVIAEEMGLSLEQTEGIRIAAVIHDIGKMAVPAEILSKTGRLSEIEFNLVKNHPQIAYDILKTVEFPWPVAQMILQHHERMDGSGYPEGISGDQIMVEARIIAVADVVEAMSSHRPYRPAYNINEVLDEISRNRGILYDPHVVDACVLIFSDKGFEFG